MADQTTQDEKTQDEVEQREEQTALASSGAGTAVADVLSDVELTEGQIEARAREVGVRADLFDEDEYSLDEYEELLGMYEDTLRDIEEGEIVKARVLRVTEASVILDVGFKSEGAVSRDEFKDAASLQPGDEVDVFLESLEDDDGVVVLSKKKADFLRVWERIKDAYENDDHVPGTLVRKIKGGVTVDLMGVDAFLPGSQIALRRVPNVEELIGNRYNFKIIKLNKRRRNIVVSRRVILEEEREKKREHLVKELMVGQVREGVVKNVTDFGGFIDLGGLDGLLHITDMSWGRVGHPSEIVNIGDTMDVKVLDIDWDRERISLGLKQLLPYPWKDVARKYPVGSRIIGRVVSITNYGAFVELEKGVEGLVHVSEMSWTRNIKHPSQLVSIGGEIEAVVLRVDPDEEKISLGMKQIEEDPWLALPVKYPTGTKVEGIVRNLTSFGAFVEIEPGIDGLIHISDMSWTKRIQHPSEVLRKGEEIEVVVLGVDAENKRISLGLKQMTDDPWYRLVEEYSPGVETQGSVARTLDDGVVVDLGDDVEGFVPQSQLGVDVSEPSDAVSEGQTVDLRVLESDAVNRRIVLAVTEIHPVEGEAEAEAEAEAEEGAEGAAEVEEEDAVEEAEAKAEEAEEAEEEEDVEEEVEDEEAAEEPEAKAAEVEAAEDEEKEAAEAEEVPEAAAEDVEEEAVGEPEAKADAEEEEAEEEDAEEEDAEDDAEPEAKGEAADEEEDDEKGDETDDAAEAEDEDEDDEADEDEEEDDDEDQEDEDEEDDEDEKG